MDQNDDWNSARGAKTPVLWSWQQWDKHKGIQQRNKKTEKEKSLGPDRIPNEVFIEGTQETRKILKAMIEKAREAEKIPQAWEEGEIIRLCKGKGTKGKCSNERGITLASNVGKVYERIINERIKKQLQITKAQAGGKPGSSTADHLIILKEAIQDITKKENSIYNIPGCTKGIWQSLAVCNTIHPPKKRNRRQNPQNLKKTELQSNSKNTN